MALLKNKTNTIYNIPSGKNALTVHWVVSDFMFSWWQYEDDWLLRCGIVVQSTSTSEILVSFCETTLQKIVIFSCLRFEVLTSLKMWVWFSELWVSERFSGVHHKKLPEIDRHGGKTLHHTLSQKHQSTYVNEIRHKSFHIFCIIVRIWPSCSTLIHPTPTRGMLIVSAIFPPKTRKFRNTQWHKIWLRGGGVILMPVNKGSWTLFLFASFWERTSRIAFSRIQSQKYRCL
jgi:hypothetical protein